MGLVYEEHPVPKHIETPSYFNRFEPPIATDGEGDIKGIVQIEAVRKSCGIAASVLERCSKIIKVGVTTEDIDHFVHHETIKLNAYPSPLQYVTFPKSVCTSVNNVICHGIPDNRPLADGDIITVELSVSNRNDILFDSIRILMAEISSTKAYHKSYHGECSATFLVGNVDDGGRHLVGVTEECLYKGISSCGPNVPLSHIGNAIQKHANDNDLNVITDFVGHGIGTDYHGPPDVCHYGILSFNSSD